MSIKETVGYGLNKSHLHNIYNFGQEAITQDNFFQLCRNKPFWLWGQKHHETWKYCVQCERRYDENQPYCHDCNSEYDKNIDENIKLERWPKKTLTFNPQLILNDIKKDGPLDCCFNHIIGCPKRDYIVYEQDENFKTIGERRQRFILPIFNWQKPLFDAFEREQDNLILKAGGIGGSAIKLRQTAMHISGYDDYDNTQVPIIVGPEKGLGALMIQRVKELFPFPIKNDRNTAKIKNTWLHVFASKNIAGIRSLENPREVILEEFDFFPIGDMATVLDTVFRYQVKSGAKVNAISTAFKPYGYCYNFVEDPGSLHVLKLHYSVAYGSIFSFEQVEIQKKKPGFEREMCLVFGGTTGNYFDALDIEAATDEYDLTPHKETTNIMGIDSGWSSSYFAIVIMMYMLGKIYVMHIERHRAPDPDFMVERIAQLRQEYFIYKIIEDGADPQFIYRLKKRFKDYPPMKYAKNPHNAFDYHAVPKELYLNMKIIPTSFSRRVMDYLYQDKLLLRNQHRVLRIHKKFIPLKNALHQVYVSQGNYKKENSDLNDYVDAFSECVDFFTIKSIIKKM